MVHIHGGEASSAVENAAERQFGKEFDDIHILSNAQVAVILQVSARSAVNRDEEINEVYRKTQKYVERFNTMTNPEKDNQELVEELDNLQEYVYPFSFFLLLLLLLLKMSTINWIFFFAHMFLFTQNVHFQCPFFISQRNR